MFVNVRRWHLCHFLLGTPLDTASCTTAMASAKGMCSLRISGLDDDLETVIERDWSTATARGPYHLVSGRWPAAPGEVIVGPDHSATTTIDSWGGRITLTVVGTAREAGWRRGDFVLAAAGTFSGFAAAGMQLSGVDAAISLFYNTPGPEPVQAGLRAMGAPEATHPGSIRPRNLVAKNPYDLEGMLAMFLPALGLATVGGVVSAFAQHRWQQRVLLSASRQGIGTGLIHTWLRSAQLRGLALWIPLGTGVGYLLSWLAQPTLQALLGVPLANPVTTWELLGLPLATGLAAMATALRLRKKSRGQSAASPSPMRHRVAIIGAFAALMAAIWCGPLLSWSPTWEELLAGLFLSLSTGLLAPSVLRWSRWLPSRTLVPRLARRMLGPTSGLGPRLTGIVIALGIVVSVVASLASSTLVLDQQLQTVSVSPANAVTIRTQVPQVRAILPTWADTAAVDSHPLWFAGPDSRGLELLLVDDLSGAHVAIGRTLSPAESKALSAGTVLTPTLEASAAVQMPSPEGKGWLSFHSLSLTTYDRFLHGRAGLMLRSAYEQKAGALPAQSNQYSLLGGQPGDVDRVVSAAITLGVGPSYYNVPTEPERFVGALWDQAQPWLLGGLSGMVMISLTQILARHIRPIRSSMFTMGLPMSLGWRLLAHQIAVVVPVVIILGMLPSMLMLAISAHNGAEVTIPVRVLVNILVTLLLSCTLGALLGSLRLRHQERFSQ